MIDENTAVNDTTGEVASPDATPAPEEQATEEVTTPEAEVATETEGGSTETGESRKGASARIRELNTENKSLKQKIAELTNPVGFQGVTPSYNPQNPVVAPGEEIDALEFERRVLTRASALSDLKIKQSEAVNRINNEAVEVLREYPELDPDSDSFNKELSDVVTEAVESHVRQNPYSASVKAFTAKLMKPYRGAVAKEVGQASENIAKQVSQAALRPTSIRKGEKTASEKSIAELERDLGIVQT